MIPLPQQSTRTDTLFPYTTRFRAVHRLARLRSEVRHGEGIVERLEQSAVGDAGGDREVVGERHRGNDGIEETRVALRDEVLLDGAAGAALAHHVRGLGEGLYEALPGHHQRLGREHVVAHRLERDRKGVGWGKRVYGRVDLGGIRIEK